jgi:hypothetical protein
MVMRSLAAANAIKAGNRPSIRISRTIRAPFLRKPLLEKLERKMNREAKKQKGSGGAGAFCTLVGSA